MIRLQSTPRAAFHPLSLLLRGALFALVLLLVLAGFARLAAAGPLDAVVGVRAVVPEDARSAPVLGTARAGTGVVIGEDGLVLTIGYLILEAASAQVVTPSGESVPAAIIAYDHDTGFGLLRASRPLGVKPVELGSSAVLEPGQPVLAVSRGVGEVAPILFTGAAYYLPYLPTKLNQQFMVMNYHVYVMATQSPDIERLQKVRMGLRDRFRVATTLGIGPRYLHSTGQLHKGGAATGVFLQAVGDDPTDLPIPGKPFGFSQLKHAQAAGDYLALKDRGLRVARVALDELLNLGA